VIADPDAVVAAVRSCASVAELSSGPIGTIATYLPGRKVPGVRLLDDEVEVHVVARWGFPVSRVAEEVRTAVASRVGAAAIDVFVDDIENPPMWPQATGM
jgi:uncharacterized alkaline shock family protein YloU